METSKFRAAQEPLKERYRKDAKAALLTLKAKGRADDSTVTCKVETGRGLAVAGIHPKCGGSGLELCSGDLLLEALIACAGVSLNAAAIRSGRDFHTDMTRVLETIELFRKASDQSHRGSISG